MVMKFSKKIVLAIIAITTLLSQRAVLPHAGAVAAGVGVGVGAAVLIGAAVHHHRRCCGNSCCKSRCRSCCSRCTSNCNSCCRSNRCCNNNDEVEYVVEK